MPPIKETGNNTHSEWQLIPSLTLTASWCHVLISLLWDDAKIQSYHTKMFAAT